jgi:hypothetical protein
MGAAGDVPHCGTVGAGVGMAVGQAEPQDKPFHNMMARVRSGKVR